MHFFPANIVLAIVSIVLLPACVDQAKQFAIKGAPSNTPLSAPDDLDFAAFKNVKSFDVFVDADQRLHLLVSGTVNGSADPVVKYVQSTDAGDSWTTPVTVNGKGFQPRVSRRGSDLQVAANGQNVVAAWQVAGEYPGMGPVALAHSSDGGISWVPGGRLGSQTVRLDQGYLDLAADRAGIFHITWLDDREERGDSQGLRYARSSDGGKTWKGERTLVDKVCTCCWTALSTSGQGQVDVLYRAVTPRDMVLIRSLDSGVNWQSVSPVGNFDWHFVGCPHAGGALQAVKSKNVEILQSLVWTGSPANQGLYFLRSEDNGRTWSTPYKMDDPHAKLGDIAAVGEFRIAAVWDSAGENSVDAFFSSSTDGGMSWKKPRRITGEGSVAKYPRIVATSKGYRVFWTEKRITGQALSTILVVN